MLKLAYFALIFPALLNATDSSWPTHFQGHRYEASRSHMYGCFGTYDEYFLTLDLEKNTYTETSRICYGGDIYHYGQRGVLQLVDNKALKIITDTAYETNNSDELIWIPIKVPARDGHYVYAPDQHFDEYDSQGQFVIRW